MYLSRYFCSSEALFFLFFSPGLTLDRLSLEQTLCSQFIGFV